MATREIQNVTIKLNDTAPGGFAGMDANSQIIPNVGDPLAAQDAATKNYVDNATAVPVNTVYIRNQSDFGATILIGGNLFFTLAINTQYILLNPILNWNIGFAPAAGGGVIVISSAHKESAFLSWQGFTNDVIIQFGTAGSSLIFKDLQINNVAGTTEFLMRATNNANRLTVKNCSISEFEKAILIENSALTLQDTFIFNPNITAPTKSLIQLDASNGVDAVLFIERNFIVNNASIPTITINNSVPRDFVINNNYCINEDEAFIDISSLDSSSRVILENNPTEMPQLFFSMSPSLNQTDSRVYAWGNVMAQNSRGYMDAKDDSTTENTITINTAGVPEEVTGRIINAGTLISLFTVTNPGVPTVPTVTCNVKGTFVFGCVIRGILDSTGGTDVLSMGIFVNGTPIDESFVPLTILVNNETPYIAAFNVELGENDEITFAVRNDTDTNNIEVNGLQIALRQIT